jgi:predicted O-methyltransferase YrrM
VELTLSRTRIGGWVLVDNVLWWGKVLDERKEKDSTAALLENFTARLAKDPSVRTSLLPLRDGVLMIEKLA